MIRLSRGDLAKLPQHKLSPVQATGRAPEHKYRAQRTVYNGRSYPSKLEADTAAELDRLVLTGDVIRWRPQVRFELVPRRGKERAVYHYVDFMVVLRGFRVIYIETKGYETDVWKLKYRLLREKCPDLDIYVVKKVSQLHEIVGRCGQVDPKS